MSREPKNQTAYADYLYNKIDDWFALGRGGFTIKELAEFSGLKPTGNFRRRINHCVAARKLDLVICLMEPKGSFNMYIPNTTAIEHPF
jgi:hypothetical protein